jgi:hypothetical protein
MPVLPGRYMFGFYEAAKLVYDGEGLLDCAVQRFDFGGREISKGQQFIVI